MGGERRMLSKTKRSRGGEEDFRNGWKTAEESGEAKFAIVHFHPYMTSHCLTI